MTALMNKKELRKVLEQASAEELIELIDNLSKEQPEISRFLIKVFSNNK